MLFFWVSCVLVSEDEFSLRTDPDEDGVDIEIDCDNSDPSIGAPYEYFFDGDNDGFGDMTSGTFYCTNPGGRWILDGTDCNDNNPQIHPTALEICDGIDNNCDDDIDYVSQDTTEGFEGITYYEDLDGDGYGSSETVESCYPLEGYVLESGDCNDNDWEVSPIAIEQCGDDVDQNCNGDIDDEACYLSAFDAQAWLRSDLSNPLGVGGIISDINGNGTLDIITNAPVSGLTPESSAAFQIFEGALGGEIYSEEADHRIYLSDEELGGTVITSDMNGDGQDDLLFSLPRNSFNGVDSGAVFLMWGPIQQDRFLSFEADAMWYGYTGSLAGYSLANLGDVTGDGISDIVIGAYKDTYNGPNSGAAYIIFGGNNEGGFSLDDSNVTLYGGADDNLGFEVSSAGDLNGDGILDVAINAYRFDTTKRNAGRTFVFFGPIESSLSLEQADILIDGFQEVSQSGSTLSSVPDINGDGSDDLLVASQYADIDDETLTNNEGCAHLLVDLQPGEISLLDSQATIYGESIDNNFGREVLGWKDINGDGFGEVVISAKKYGAEFSDQGRISLFLGPLEGSYTSSEGHALIYGARDLSWTGLTMSSYQDEDNTWLLIGSRDKIDGNIVGESFLFSVNFFE